MLATHCKHQHDVYNAPMGDLSGLKSYIDAKAALTYFHNMKDEDTIDLTTKNGKYILSTIARVVPDQIMGKDSKGSDFRLWEKTKKQILENCPTIRNLFAKNLYYNKGASYTHTKTGNVEQINVGDDDIYFDQIPLLLKGNLEKRDVIFPGERDVIFPGDPLFWLEKIDTVQSNKQVAELMDEAQSAHTSIIDGMINVIQGKTPDPTQDLQTLVGDNAEWVSKWMHVQKRIVSFNDISYNDFKSLSDFDTLGIKNNTLARVTIETEFMKKTPYQISQGVIKTYKCEYRRCKQNERRKGKTDAGVARGSSVTHDLLDEYTQLYQASSAEIFNTRIDSVLAHFTSPYEDEDTGNWARVFLGLNTAIKLTAFIYESWRFWNFWDFFDAWTTASMFIQVHAENCSIANLVHRMERATRAWSLIIDRLDYMQCDGEDIDAVSIRHQTKIMLDLLHETVAPLSNKPLCLRVTTSLSLDSRNKIRDRMAFHIKRMGKGGNYRADKFTDLFKAITVSEQLESINGIAKQMSVDTADEMKLTQSVDHLNSLGAVIDMLEPIKKEYGGFIKQLFMNKDEFHVIETRKIIAALDSMPQPQTVEMNRIVADVKSRITNSKNIENIINTIALLENEINQKLSETCTELMSRSSDLALEHYKNVRRCEIELAVNSMIDVGADPSKWGKTGNFVATRIECGDNGTTRVKRSCTNAKLASSSVVAFVIYKVRQFSTSDIPALTQAFKVFDMSGTQPSRTIDDTINRVMADDCANCHAEAIATAKDHNAIFPSFIPFYLTETMGPACSEIRSKMKLIEDHLVKMGPKGSDIRSKIMKMSAEDSFRSLFTKIMGSARTFIGNDGDAAQPDVVNLGFVIVA